MFGFYIGLDRTSNFELAFQLDYGSLSPRNPNRLKMSPRTANDVRSANEPAIDASHENRMSQRSTNVYLQRLPSRIQHVRRQNEVDSCRSGLSARSGATTSQFSFH